MGTDYYRTMEQGGKKAAAATRETQRSLADLNSQLATVRSSAAGLAGAWAGAFATHQLVQFADTWNQLNGRLRLASSSSEDYVQSQRVLMEISQRTGTSLEANSNLYSRIAQSLRDAGYASADVAKVTETVATSLKLSGASTEDRHDRYCHFRQWRGAAAGRGAQYLQCCRSLHVFNDETAFRLPQSALDAFKKCREHRQRVCSAGQIRADGSRS